jgi:hypothetical protein
MSLDPTCGTGPDDGCRQKVAASQKKRDAIVIPRICGLPWKWAAVGHLSCGYESISPR